MSHDASLLQISGLTVGYLDADQQLDEALRAVSLSVRAGGVTAIIGESGSGKSTLAHSIVRLLPDNARILNGSIDFAGQDLLDVDERPFRSIRGRDIGFVPQDPIASLNPTKTIRAQLREAFALARSPLPQRAIDERIADDLFAVGFEHPEEILARYPHELSGGMRQRVLVAIAFSQRPALVIADEPTSALDVLVGRDVLQSIHAARHLFETTVVLITHDLALAAQNAEDVVVMHNGVVVEAGPVAEVFAHPQHPYTRELLASSRRVREGRVLSISETFRARSGTSTEPAVAAPAVELNAVTKTFPRRHRSGEDTIAMDDVTLRVSAGSTFALVGESGSGKTTTSRVIAGLERPDDGEVRVLGEDVTRLKRRQLRELRRDMQIVYQSPFESLNPSMSLGAIIAEPLVAFGVGSRTERAARVAELLDVVGLPSSYARRRPQELSGGQRQRVAIARSLAPRPRLLVLDEPVSALDATIQAQILGLLGKIQREFDLTYFLITHDLAVVADIAQDVAVMRHGRIVEHGTVADVVLNPQHGYTEALLSV